MNYDKLYFEALQTLSKDRTPGSVGEKFSVCQNALQGIYSSLSEEQIQIINDYMIALDKLHESAFKLCVKQKVGFFSKGSFLKTFLQKSARHLR